jgi:hypothetical protein
MPLPDRRIRPSVNTETDSKDVARVPLILTQPTCAPLAWRRRWDRRRAANELNALLGRPTRPDLDQTCPRISLREVL